MQLDSYLEIFTTMYGWAFANIIGGIIVGTGLVVVPFGIIIFRAWHKAKEQGLQSAGVIPLLESVQTQLLVALFVLSVCFATSPLTTLGSVGLNYAPPPSLANPAPQEGSLDGGTGTGYDSAMQEVANGSLISSGRLDAVPAWWFTVMAISSGVNHAVRNGVQGSTSQIREIESMARTATIHNSGLLYEMNRFRSECFRPMLSKYQKEGTANLSASGQMIVAPSNSDYGPTDVDWMGSQLFRDEPGYYDAERSKNPVPGFVVDYSRDTNYYPPSGDARPPVPVGAANPEWGMPTCKQWWEDPANGLREKIIKDAYNADDGGIYVSLVERLQQAFMSQDRAKDVMARNIDQKTKPDFVDTAATIGSTSGDKIMNALRSGVKSFASSFGVIPQAMKAGISEEVLVVVLPMFQALVLMALYMFLPLIVFLSGYSLQAMFLGAIAIFTVKFWSSMWFIAHWVDDRLVSAMYPGGGNAILGVLGIQGASSYKNMVLGFLLVALYIGLPIVWTAMMGWVGLRVGNELTDMARGENTRATGIAAAGYGATVGTATSAAKAVIRK